MLFNSYDFLFGFLPVALLGHHVLVRRSGTRAAWIWLVLVSLFFYAWWYPPYLALLVGSMVANYAVGRITSSPDRSDTMRSGWLTIGVVGNLSLLGWFKYAGFFDRTLLTLTGVDLPIPDVALPLAISFFTFQQIAYLVDAYRGNARSYDFLDYTLFVSFFPQLIAGPIIHHGEVIPQFREGQRPTSTDRAVGITMFVLGLAKKVILADTMAIYADRIYGGAAAGQLPTVLGAWMGATAFYFQVYFDFSGYSDMAVGLARLFGIKLPVNFDAPYRAANVIDLWRRWHVTLSRFLRDYLYFVLGGNRRGPVRRYFNLFATMVLGGLWHGAAWTFVAWGALHGIFLLMNHAWHWLHGGPGEGRVYRVLGRLSANMAFLVAAIFFRADSFDDALAILAAMVGLAHAGMGQLPAEVPWFFLFLFALTQLAPTSQRWLEAYEPVLQQGVDTLRWRRRLMWTPSTRWGIVIGLLAVLCLPFLERAAPFIYFQF